MSVKLHINPARKLAGEGVALDIYAPACAEAARAFHRSFREYAPTPLVSLPGLAAQLGLKEFLVKDESRRFGLNAFKVLGASYAVGHILADRLGRDMAAVTRDILASAETRKALGPLVFVSATDGNHGCGLAWTARDLGFQSRIFMPRGSARVRVDAIGAEKAECTVTDLNYDDTVRHCRNLAAERGYILVQDTAWQGYEAIPTWIMQGYMTLALEALLQMADLRPTHCFLQAGVGSFAGAMTGFLTAALGPDAPRFIIVEPHAANCIYTSAVAGDGRPHAVAGDLAPLMAGLACGEPNTLSWGVLRDYATAYVSVPDCLAANGMRILAAPTKNAAGTPDPAIVSGESGACTTGAVHWLMTHPAAREGREALELDASSSVLVVSTEGDTAPETYRDIVWKGACPQDF